jgi:hypothetical protein
MITLGVNELIHLKRFIHISRVSYYINEINSHLPENNIENEIKLLLWNILLLSKHYNSNQFD